MKKRIDIYIVLLFTIVLAACSDRLEVVVGSGNETGTGEKVLLSAGTTDAVISTRADAKTYYMPAAHRFVCKMYYKTPDSGDNYDVDLAHTAWLKVDDKGVGNALYWKNSYPSTAQREDSYGNDEFAPTFYWQNRREHAFLAWTDLNKATTIKGSSMHFSESKPYSEYEYHTGKKEATWLEKNVLVYNYSSPFTNRIALRDFMTADGTTGIKSDESQTAQKAFASTLGDLPSVTPYYDFESRCIYCTIERPAGYSSSYIPIDETHRKTQWYKMTIYDTESKKEYTGDTSNTQVTSLGTFVVDSDGTMIAFQDPSDEKFYECDSRGLVICPTVKYVCCFQIYESKENTEIIEEYPAMAFDLSSGTKTAMSQQPDILQALATGKVPTSSVMENNRVHLYFKHQFSQVQVNLKNSVDNSVLITKEQIDSVQLLGVTNTGYMFTSMNPDGTLNVPAGFKSSTFKEIVATDYTDEQLETNPYGSCFNMFERTPLTDDEMNISKIVKSYEGITFGRLQAIRISWHEDGGIEHVSTFRVPEKNDQGQPLRLLEQGKKYIWNMELRRGTLAVIRTEIIPWEENQEVYDVDGFIKQ